MDSMRQTIGLDNEPDTVSFDTSHGTVTVPVEPFLGPGIYEVTVHCRWADGD